MYHKFCGPVKPATVEPMVSFMSQLHINARRRRKFSRISAYRMFWKQFGNKGQSASDFILFTNWPGV